MKKHIYQWDETVLASSLKAISMKVIKEASVSMIATWKWLPMQCRSKVFSQYGEYREQDNADNG